MTVLNLMTPAEFISGITTWASPLFDEFLTVVYVTVGFVAAGIILIWLGGTIIDALNSLLGRKNDNPF